MAAPMPAISSSACRVRTPNDLCFDSSWRMSEAGVIGYEPRNSGRSESSRGGDEPPRERRVAVDVRVGPGGQGGRVDLVGVVEELGRLAERVARLERGDVGVAHLGLVAELRVDPAQRLVDGPRVHPGHQPEGEEVLRALGVAGLHPQRLHGPQREARHRHLVDRVGLEAAIGERVVVVAGLGEVARLEGVLVDDHRAARSRGWAARCGARPGSWRRARWARRRGW